VTRHLTVSVLPPVYPRRPSPSHLPASLAKGETSCAGADDAGVNDWVADLGCPPLSAWCSCSCSAVIPCGSKQAASMSYGPALLAVATGGPEQCRHLALRPALKSASEATWPQPLAHSSSSCSRTCSFTTGCATTPGRKTRGILEIRRTSATSKP